MRSSQRCLQNFIIVALHSRAMNTLSATLAAALVATVAAGCSSGSSAARSAFVPNAAASAAGAVVLSGDGTSRCKKTGGCRAKLVLPLSFDGKRVTVGKVGSCRNVSLDSAKSFIAPKTHHFTLKAGVTLQPSCARFYGDNASLFIAVARVGTHSARATPLTPLAGPVNPNARPWTFAPVSTGVAMTAKSRFAFFVVAVPADETAPTPPPDAPSGTFKLLAPMSYDGTSFAQTGTCSNNVQDAPAYTAPSDGALQLSANVSAAPTCAPDGGDDAGRQLYLVAVQTESSGSQDGARTRRPREDGGGIPAIAIAGPVNAADSAWSFAPDAPGLTMQAGMSYAFFIAEMRPAAPATPEPPQS